MQTSLVIIDYDSSFIDLLVIDGIIFHLSRYYMYIIVRYFSVT